MIDKHEIKNIMKGILEDEIQYLPSSYLNDYVLSEQDFYPPPDDRVFESYIEDIEGGDNFVDYCEYIFDLYEEEGYYEN